MLKAHRKRGLPVTSDWLNPGDPIQTGRIVQIGQLTNSVPHTQTELRSLLQRGHLVRIAITNGFVVGFVLYEALRAGRRIVSIAVDPEFHRRGIGSLLIGCLKRRIAGVTHLTEIEALLPERRLTAQQFFRANQFRWTATIESDSGDGVYVMRYVRSPNPSKAMTTAECIAQTSKHDPL